MHYLDTREEVLVDIDKSGIRSSWYGIIENRTGTIDYANVQLYKQIS